jgi:hypothetical protein
VTFPVVLTVVAATVLGVVAPTVPLMLMDAVPVRFVTVPLVGVPNAPLNNTGAPALPVLTAKAVAMPVPRPDTPVLMGRPVALVRIAADGVPRFGVTRVGLVSTTNFVPVPVCEAMEVALPDDVITPVRLALVTTVAANEPVPLPVTPPVSVMVWSPVFVPLRLLPVTVPLAEIDVAVAAPSAGLTKVGEVANTSAPDPVSSLITPASSAEVVAAKAESLSVVTTKVLEAGTVVPLRVVVLDDERLVKAPEDGFAAPIAVFVRPTAE